jgi:glycosyltransferase involved in cell wall biosynthesis
MLDDDGVGTLSVPVSADRERRCHLCLAARTARAGRMQMKLALSCSALRHSGGLERYAMDLVRGFAAAGIRPACFARSFDPSAPESRLVDRYPVNVSFIPGKLRDHWFSWRLRALRRHAGVDVLIGCNRVDSSEIAICGGTHRGFLAAMGRRPRRSDNWQIKLESRQYENAKIIVAHSELMRTELRQLYEVDDAKIRVLFPPVETAQFSPVDDDTRRAWRRQYGFADDEVVLLFPSSSHERKGLPLVEAAVREMPLRVVVAVAGRPPERESSNVRYVGYVKNIEQAYCAADFTILASKYEPFGLVGVESVRCGTPVIFPSDLGCCDVIAEHAKFVFRPGDLAHLKETIVQAAQHAGALDETARRALSRNAILYDTRIDHHVDRLLAMADEIALHQ